MLSPAVREIHEKKWTQSRLKFGNHLSDIIISPVLNGDQIHMWILSLPVNTGHDCCIVSSGLKSVSLLLGKRT